MTCAEFLSRLQFLLDQHRDPQQDATLASHAMRCTTCHERLLAEEQLFLVLSAAASDWCTPGGRVNPLDGPGTSSVMVPHRNDTRTVRTSQDSVRLVIYGIATTAALLAVVLFARPKTETSLAMRSTNSPQEFPTQAVKTQANRPMSAASHRHSVRKPTTPELVVKAAERPLLPIASAEPPVVSSDPSLLGNRLSLTNLGLVVETQQLTEFYDTLRKTPTFPETFVPQVDQIADEFLPLAQPFVSVLNVLRRTIPGAKAPAVQPLGDETTGYKRGSAWA